MQLEKVKHMATGMATNTATNTAINMAITTDMDMATALNLN